MSKYVPDISSRRWVIIADGREKRPDETNGQGEANGKCPFCPGHEYMTPPEVYRVGEGGPGQDGWEVRVIPNRYPITDFHEVIIHAPQEDELHHLPLTHIEKVFTAYRERFNHYRDHGQVMIFCNHGAQAGASILHPHSQLVVIPNQINLSTLNCEPLDNIVWENTYFNIYCPDFSQWPYEVWIAPKKGGTFFGDITQDEIKDLVEIYVRILDRLAVLYESTDETGQDFSYNFYIYPKENWYIRIIPRFVSRAGFELGTGLSVNVIDPKDAAEELRVCAKRETSSAKRSIVEEGKRDVIQEKDEEIERLKEKLERYE